MHKKVKVIHPKIVNIISTGTLNSSSPSTLTSASTNKPLGKILSTVGSANVVKGKIVVKKENSENLPHKVELVKAQPSKSFELSHKSEMNLVKEPVHLNIADKIEDDTDILKKLVKPKFYENYSSSKDIESSTDRRNFNTKIYTDRSSFEVAYQDKNASQFYMPRESFSTYSLGVKKKDVFKSLQGSTIGPKKIISLDSIESVRNQNSSRPRISLSDLESPKQDEVYAINAKQFKNERVDISIHVDSSEFSNEVVKENSTNIIRDQSPIPMQDNRKGVEEIKSEHLPENSIKVDENDENNENNSFRFWKPKKESNNSSMNPDFSDKSKNGSSIYHYSPDYYKRDNYREAYRSDRFDKFVGYNRHDRKDYSDRYNRSDRDAMRNAHLERYVSEDKYDRYYRDDRYDRANRHSRREDRYARDYRRQDMRRFEARSDIYSQNRYIEGPSRKRPISDESIDFRRKRRRSMSTEDDKFTVHDNKYVDNYSRDVNDIRYQNTELYYSRASKSQVDFNRRNDERNRERFYSPETDEIVAESSNTRPFLENTRELDLNKKDQVQFEKVHKKDYQGHTRHYSNATLHQPASMERVDKVINNATANRTSISESNVSELMSAVKETVSHNSQRHNVDSTELKVESQGNKLSQKENVSKTSTPPIHDEIDNGIDLINKKHYAKGIVILENELSKKKEISIPTHRRFRIYYKLSYACHKVERFSDVEEYASKAFAISKPSPKLLAIRAKARFYQKNFFGAKEDIEKAIELIDPNSTTIDAYLDLKTKILDYASFHE